MFKEYMTDLYATYQRGDAREESYYPAFAAMLKKVADSTGRSDVHVTTLPTSTDAGNPDFRLWNGSNRIVGYVEAKKPTEQNLDQIEKSEQLKRYRATFPNLILTNFFEFRLYRNGEPPKTVLVAQPFDPTRQRPPVLEKPDELSSLLESFLGFSLPKAYNAESLAVELAKRTRFLRDVVAQQLAQEEKAPGLLSGFFDAFQTYLIGTLKPMDFADLFAQTLTYGLFAARTRVNGEAAGGFSRLTAFNKVPHTIGVLRQVFRFLSLDDFPQELAWCVDDIAQVLAVADTPAILGCHYQEGRSPDPIVYSNDDVNVEDLNVAEAPRNQGPNLYVGRDPIVHFYETFLAKYDPAERERRGVYYTPEPVVGYIVRSLHGILKTDFGMVDGLASEGVTLLDPAAGTMTFIARAAQVAVAKFVATYGTGGREDFIRRHVLKNFYAFELMMAPYTVGHLKTGFVLEELGHRLTDDERVSFYLTNTLDNEELEQSRLPGFSALAEESKLAGDVKKNAPILVILGNPPYSGVSSNMGEWIMGLIEDYKYVDGKHFGEKKHWLQDDYVKFLRFAQWKIERTGKGVVGMITNHGYLDNPTFRGMRQSLMRTFDDIYILDLHGNALKKETCPDGSPDKNVFDIRQGVAIAFFVKRGGMTKNDATVRHVELYGLRGAKYRWLNEHDHVKTGWQELQPATPFYLFVPRNEDAAQQYEAFVPVDHLFPVNVTGIVTARDGFVLDFDKNALLRRIAQFRDFSLTDEFIRHVHKLKDTRGWKLTARRKDLAKLEDWRDYAVSCLYRPFDTRSLYYHPYMVDWGRLEVMRHMLAGENLALCIGRQGQVVGAFEWNLVYCSKDIEDFNLYYRGGNVNYPLYLYPPAGGDLYAHHEAQGRKPNLNPALVSALTAAYGEAPTPEAIFHYVYAVLYSPTYRAKYAGFLKMDFPRVPFTANAVLFGRLAALGEKLVGLHLLRSPDLNTPACRFLGEGTNLVEGVRYDATQQRVYINATKHFALVPEVVWKYQVGGYQVCEKWLKDRKERNLELDDIRTYCRIVTALGRTIELQQQIDALYPEAESNTVHMPVSSACQEGRA